MLETEFGDDSLQISNNREAQNLQLVFNQQIMPTL